MSAPDWRWSRPGGRYPRLYRGDEEVGSVEPGNPGWNAACDGNRIDGDSEAGVAASLREWASRWYGEEVPPLPAVAAPDWHVTARLLAAHPKRPAGLLMYTVSEGGAAYQCDGCGAALSEDERTDCPHCPEDESPWPIVTSYPDAVHIIALDDSPSGLANMGPLLMALRGAGSEHKPPKRWRVEVPTHGTTWIIRTPPDLMDIYSATLAHALALAFLAVHR